MTKTGTAGDNQKDDSFQIDAADRGAAMPFDRRRSRTGMVAPSEELLVTQPSSGQGIDIRRPAYSPPTLTTSIMQRFIGVTGTHSGC